MLSGKHYAPPKRTIADRQSACILHVYQMHPKVRHEWTAEKLAQQHGVTVEFAAGQLVGRVG